ncbi:Pyruvate dehydrogenase complex protein X component, mitochondrial [Candida viswanathii]|uniref:Dihydrolipoamide dehydrogenase-binding protein of pyruvate dehydrogenase complex n=1 Tax=Candida viswanathii TaxID=5486 RepID=A0A367YEM6_9ASCO|nr:Pyruvate dehydrogenase complex protein X component, mitochondrial [Candida viswanathii]
MLRAAFTRRTITQIRSIHKTPIYYAASVFKMPAMSPTMSEGGIVSWKVKPGDNYSAGDVILEVETDKANIDVEATDDGKLWEILVNEGTSGVPVGKAIAFIAEPDDDLSSLEKPAIEEVSAPAKAPEPPKEEPKEEAKPTAPAKSAAPADTSILQKPNPSQKLSPAVELLLHENNISTEDAFAKIQASGPNGRILKGDVLAYLGQINSESIVSLAEFLKSREHLDLSNIVLAKPSEAAEGAAAKEEGAKKEEAAPAKAEKPKPTNILSVELTSNLGEDVSQAKFKFAFEKSVASAIRHTYAAKFPEFANSPTASSIYDKYDVFDDIISAPVTKNRFEVYDIEYKFYGASVAPKKVKVDDFDDLLGLATPVQYLETGSSNVGVQFKIKFDDKLSDSKQFVEYFENSLLSQIPANKLKITNL